MFNFTRKLKFAMIFLLVLDLHAQDLDTPKEKKYNLSICAIFKNEATFLKEWIEYHILVGVDHFFLYNAGSTDHFMKVLQPYLMQEIVTLVDWIPWGVPEEEDDACSWALAVQIPAYENAVRFLASGQTKWLTFIDVHEFLVSPTSDRISDLLEKYDQYPGVALSCDFFDASKNSHFSVQRKLLIQTVELTKPLAQNPQREITKMIFKPEACKGPFALSPYICEFKNLQIAKNMARSELRINNYLNRNLYSPFKKKKEKLRVDNRLLTREETIQILTLDYEIEDQENAISRFIPKLTEKMGFNLHWGW